MSSVTHNVFDLLVRGRLERVATKDVDLSRKVRVGGIKRVFAPRVESGTKLPQEGCTNKAQR